VKRLVLSLTLVVGLVVASDARAHDAYDDTQSHPLRLLAYALHPAGFALEWAFTRPIHFLVSTPGLDRVFGHTPHREARIALPFHIGLDTGLVYGNKLSCLDVDGRRLLQVPRGGRRVDVRDLDAEFAAANL